MALEYSFTSASAVALNTVLVGPTEVGRRKGFSLQVSSLGTSGQIAIDGSNDGSSWVVLRTVNVNTGVVGNAVSAAGMYVGSTQTRYMRVRMSTASTSGATTLTCRITEEAQNDVAAIPMSTQPVSLATLPALTAGSALIGKIINDMSATIANGPAFSVARLVAAAASTNATSVKTSAGRVAKIRGYNAKTSVVYLKLYNKASAPTVGTDTPIVTIPLKASDTFDIDYGNFGLNFSTGIAYAITAAVADSDTTALVASDVVGMSIVYI